MLSVCPGLLSNYRWGLAVCCDLDCRTDKLLHMAVYAISMLAGRSDFPFICEVKEKSLVNQPGSNVRISFLEEDRTKQLATNCAHS